MDLFVPVKVTWNFRKDMVFLVLTCEENGLHGALENENKATLCEKVKIQA